MDEDQDMALLDDSSETDIFCGDCTVTVQDLGIQPEMAARVAPMAPAAPAVIEDCALRRMLWLKQHQRRPPQPGPAPGPIVPYEFPRYDGRDAGR